MFERYILQPFDGLSWDTILDLADTAIPFDLEGNRETIHNRERFDYTQFIRRHYAVVDDHTGNTLGYGTIEQQREPTHYRQFIIVASGRLWGSVGQMLYDQLHDDLKEVGAHEVWMREYFDDVALLNFFKARGFMERAVTYDLRRFGLANIDPLRNYDVAIRSYTNMHQAIVLSTDKEAIACAEDLGFRHVFSYVHLEKYLQYINLLV